MHKQEKTKVLVIRTVKAEMIPGLINSWKEQLADSEYDLLTHYGQDNVKYYKEIVGEVHIYEARKDFYISHLGLALMKKIRSRHYDLIIFPHRWPTYKGFGNVLMMMLFLNGKKLAHCTKDGQIEYIDKSIFFKIIANTILTGVVAITVAPIALTYGLARFVVSKLTLFEYRQRKKELIRSRLPSSGVIQQIKMQE